MKITKHLLGIFKKVCISLIAIIGLLAIELEIRFDSKHLMIDSLLKKWTLFGVKCIRLYLPKTMHFFGIRSSWSGTSEIMLKLSARSLLANMPSQPIRINN